MRSFRPVGEFSAALDMLASAGQPWLAVSFEGVVVGWNRWSEQLFGWSQEEILGRPLSDFRVSVDDPVVARALREMPEDPEALAGRKVLATVEHRAGHELQIELTVAMRWEDDVPIYHAFAFDVTEARRVERFVNAQRAVTSALTSRSRGKDVMAEALEELGRHLNAEIGVVWSGEDLSVPTRIFGPPASAEQERALVARIPPDPIAESVETSRTVFRRTPRDVADPFTALWIPVWAGPQVWGILQLVTSKGRIAGSLALDVLTSTGAQVGYAMHQQQAEERLRSAAELNRRILETSREAIIGLDREVRVTFANPAASRAFHAASDSLVGRTLKELVDARSQEAQPAVDAITEAVTTRSALRVSDVHFPIDGSDFVVEYTCSPIEDASGGAVLTFRDVTKRRELEAARERDLDFLQTLLDSLEEGVLACDADGKLSLFNHSMRNFLGRDVEAIGPEKWSETFGLRDPETLKAIPFEQLPLYRALQGEAISGATVLIRRADCEERLLNVNARPLVGAGGHRLGAVATVRDMTDHQTTVARMDEAERLAGVGVWEYNLTTPEVYWSDGMYRILGFEPGSVQPGAEVWQARMHPDDIDGAWHHVHEMLESDTHSWEQRYRIYRADGALRWVHSHSEKVVDADGVVRRLRGTMQDYTEAADAEAALRRSEARARQRDRMNSLGQLAGGIAHDFNNLLAVMLSFAEFALDDLPPDSPARSDLEEIRRAAERAADLTQRLLVFSRGEAVRARPLDIGKLVTELEPMLHRTLGEHLEVVIDLEPGLGPVSADPTQIEQILINLALNARDAMPGGGQLRITASATEISVSDDEHLEAGHYIRITVSDTGVGMSADVAAHVFEPFFTTKPKGRGTGLGLATVYGVVHEAGGSITVRSAPGRGSTFVIYLPVTASPVAEEEKPESLPAGSRHASRVLVVEDDAMVRAATERILERGGYEVLSAPGAAEALALLAAREGHVDLLVSDVVMAGLSGWQLHQRVAERWPGIPTLFMSGHTDDLVGREALSGDGIDFIAKPFVASSLLAKVAAALG